MCPTSTVAPASACAAIHGGQPRARQRRQAVRLRQFRRVVLVAALILGSHAMHDSFAVIRWGAAGIGPDAAGLLWSESVAAEVVVFFIIGRPLLDRLGPAGAAPRRRVWCGGRSRRRQLGSPPWRRYSRSTG
jgi:hypothetical protein